LGGNSTSGMRNEELEMRNEEWVSVKYILDCQENTLRYCVNIKVLLDVEPVWICC